MDQTLDNVIDERIRRMVESALAERLPPQVEVGNSVAEETRRTLEIIKAKDVATPNEAALLLGCSASHLRNQVSRAIEGSIDPPIPYYDLGGPTVFPITELLAWSRLPKRKLSGKTTKNKTHLEVVAS